MSLLQVDTIRNRPGDGSPLFDRGISVSGVITSTSIKASSIGIGSTEIISSLFQLKNIVSIDSITLSTLESALELTPNTFNSLYIGGGGVSTFTGNVYTLGITTINNDLYVTGNLFSSSSGGASLSSLSIGSTQVISESRELQNIISLVVSGISTLGVTSATNLTTQNINNFGITTSNSLNIGSTQVISSSRQLQNIASLDSTTIATIETAIANAPNTFTDLEVTGITTTQSINVGTSGTVITTTSSGLVGIGTTNPTTSLTVNGNVNVSGVVEATSFTGNLTGTATTASIAIYANSSGIATFSDYAEIAGFSTFSDYADIAGFSTFSDYANTSGFSTSSDYAEIAGFSTTSGYANSSGIATYANTAGFSTSSGYSNIAGFSTSSDSSSYAEIAGFSTSSGYSNIAGFSTSSNSSSYAETAGFSTSSGYAEIAGFSTSSNYAEIAGFSTSSDYAITAGIATSSNYAEIAGFSTSSGYAITAGIATVAEGITGSPNIEVGIVTASQGFISAANTTPIQIFLVGNQLTFTAVGIGLTTFTLS